MASTHHQIDSNIHGGETVSIYRDLFEDKDLNKMRSNISTLLSSINDCSSFFSGNLSKANLSLDQLQTNKQQVKETTAKLNKLLESDLRFSAYARCELLNSSVDNPSLLKPYYPNLEDESLIKEAKNIAALFLEQLNSVFVVKKLLTSIDSLLAIIESQYANQAVLAESLNHTSHLERLKIHTATENTSDDVSNSNEGDVTNEASNSVLEQLETNTNDGSTTKHNSAMNVLLQNAACVSQQHLKEKMSQLKNLQKELKAAENSDQQKMGECFANSDLQNKLRETVASSKPYRDELKSKISALEQEIAELEQLLTQKQKANADLARASKSESKGKESKRRCYGTAQHIGFYMKPTTKPSITYTEDGIKSSAVFTFNLQGRAIRLLYAAFNQQLELEQKEDSVTGSKGYKLVPKPTDELYDCRVKINLYFPDKIVNGRWYGTFSEESSVPEYFYPITALQQEVGCLSGDFYTSPSCECLV